MLNDERRTPMKRTPFKRAAPTTKSHSNQAAALTSQALTAIKTRAPLRASTYAAPTEPAAPIAKSAPVRSEAQRRLLVMGLIPPSLIESITTASQGATQ